MNKTEAFEYEVGTMSLFESIFYSVFPRLFANKVGRKWRKYIDFCRKVDALEKSKITNQ